LTPGNEKLMGDYLHNIGLINLEYTTYYENAITYFQKAVDVRTQCLGDTHVDVMRSLYRLGITQYAIEKYDEAASSLENAFERSTSLLVSTQFVAAEILNNLACVYYHLKDINLSKYYFEKSFLIQKKILRDEIYGDYEVDEKDKFMCIINLATTDANMGFIRLILGEMEDALAVLEPALLNQTLVLDRYNILIMSTLENLAAANFYHTSKSLKIYTQLLRLVITVHGPNHILCAKLWSKMGRIHLRVKNHPRVLECVHHVIECYRKNASEDIQCISEFDELVQEELGIHKKLHEFPANLMMASF